MIRHIFFDLDRTLWDFEYNSKQTLLELVDRFNLIDKGIDSGEEFISKYRLHNNRLWNLYRNGKIKKEQLRDRRFFLTLQDYGIDDSELANKFGLAYVKYSPLKKKLFPNTIELLNYLVKNYSLYIITNGFQEVQHIKLENSGISKYFNFVITSEEVGVKKPDSSIFHYALELAKAKAEESIMIGDDLFVDVKGAEAVGMQGVYFNPNKIKHNETVFAEVSSLSDIFNLL